MYEFFFKSSINDTLDFTGELRRIRCEGRTAGGERCKINVSIGLPYCPHHQKSEALVQIMDSPGRGKGLYAFSPEKDASDSTIVFKTGVQVLPHYDAEVITHDELVRRYAEGDTYNAPYALAFEYERVVGEDGSITLRPLTYLDAACHRGLASIMNHAKTRNELFPSLPDYRYANCRFKARGNWYKPSRISICATRDIMHGEELLIDYGGEAKGLDVDPYYDDSSLYTNPGDIVTGTRVKRN